MELLRLFTTYLSKEDFREVKMEVSNKSYVIMRFTEYNNLKRKKESVLKPLPGQEGFLCNPLEKGN